ncbi:MAG: DUF3592 domain-containing protein [Saprospiraceae bacterium]
MSKQKKYLRLKVILFLLFTLIGCGYKIHNVHKIALFSFALNVELICVVIGLMIFFVPMMFEIDAQKPRTFLINSKQWNITWLWRLSLMALLVTVALSITFLTKELSESWLSYRIDQNPVVQSGLVTGFKRVETFSKLSNSTQEFVELQFQHELRMQRGTLLIDHEPVLRLGDKIPIKFNRTDPTLLFFLTKKCYKSDRSLR